jgi:hypothetical protein
MPAVKSLVKRHSAIFSGLGSYFSLLRSGGNKGSSYGRSQQKDHSGIAGKAESDLSQSEIDGQYSKLVGAELGQMKAVKTSTNRGGRQDMDDAVIHVKNGIHHTWETRPVHENRDAWGVRLV